MYNQVQCACADESSPKLCYYGVDHTPHCRPSCKSSCSNPPCIKCQRSLSSNLPPDYDKEQTSPLASLEAWWPAEQASQMRGTLRCSLENSSLWPLGHGTLVCAHGTTILTNCESSELVGEHIFYALQVRTRTI